MHFDAVLFDMDGVLIDSEPGYQEAGRVFFARRGLPFGENEIRAITGSTAPVIAGRILQWKPDLAETKEELADCYTRAIQTALEQNVTSLVPGAYDWIRRLREAGVKLAIGSSSSWEMVSSVADRFGLTPMMDAIVTCRDVRVGKPAPDIFLLCCERLGVAPGRALVIEDSLNGIRAAKAAGCICAAFTGTDRSGLDVSSADLSFPAFSEGEYRRLFER